jgi:hypothetical protein
MHRIHAAYLMQAGGFSKFWLGKSFVSASFTEANWSYLFFGNRFSQQPELLAGQPAPDQGSSSVAAVAGRGSWSVISVSPIRSWLAEAGTGDLGVGAGPEFLESSVCCGGFG